MHYPIAIIQKDEVFYGLLPDLPELKIKAPDITAVISQARICIIQHLYALAADEQPLPTGSDISTHLTNNADSKNQKNNFSGCTWAIVSINAARILGADISVGIEIPERLWHRAQEYLHKTATAHGAKNDATQPLPTSIISESVTEDSIANERLNQLMLTALSAYLKNNDGI